MWGLQARDSFCCKTITSWKSLVKGLPTRQGDIGDITNVALYVVAFGLYYRVCHNYLVDYTKDLSGVWVEKRDG